MAQRQIIENTPRDRVVRLLQAARAPLDYESLYHQSGFSGNRDAFDLLIGRLVHDRVITRLTSDSHPGFVLPHFAKLKVKKDIHKPVDSKSLIESRQVFPNPSQIILTKKAKSSPANNTKPIRSLCQCGGPKSSSSTLCMVCWRKQIEERQAEKRRKYEAKQRARIQRQERAQLHKAMTDPNFHQRQQKLLKSQEHQIDSLMSRQTRMVNALKMIEQESGEGFVRNIAHDALLGFV